MPPRTRAGGLLCILLLACSSVPANAQDSAAGERKHGYCASCHGIEGQSFKPHYPILAGQSAAYLVSQLSQFKNGRRHDPSMNTVAKQLSTQDMRDLAAFFASVEPRPGHFTPDAKKAARGKARAAKAGCTGCHARSADSASQPNPRIAGQKLDYLKKQLRDFRDGRRSDASGIMHAIAKTLSDADIDDLGNYYAALP